MDFLKFTSMIFGGGVAYDIYTKMKNYSGNTNKLGVFIPHFFLLCLICQIVSTIILFFGMDQNTNNYISLSISFVGIFGAIYVAINIGSALEQLK